MDYNTLLDLVAELGYQLAMAGAETYRIEESANRILAAYGITSEAFAIPNCLIVSIETPDGKPMTRMRRIGYHGNDLDAVEMYNSLSRAICKHKPDMDTAQRWLREVKAAKRSFPLPLVFLGHFMGAFGFCFVFGGTLADAICAGVCGLLVALVNLGMDYLKVNQFFRTITAAFLMAIPAYGMCVLGLGDNVDAVIIGGLMLLVPGLLFTNAMRDIIYGDTNSGVNRIVQVFLIAAALCLGTGTAWALASAVWEIPTAVSVEHGFLVNVIGAALGCIGFSILFNIHGPGGLLCTLGGMITWILYLLVFRWSGSDILAYFWASVTAALYAEVMARVRKYPAISYLVVSIFPLIPGAGVYYTMNHVVRGDMAAFAERGMHTIAIAGVMAVGLLLVSTGFRLLPVRRTK